MISNCSFGYDLLEVKFMLVISKLLFQDMTEEFNFREQFNNVNLGKYISRLLLILYMNHRT